MKTINDYAELVKEKHALNKTIAPVETNETDASRAYAVGEQLIFNGTLYDVIVPISQHDVITTTGSGANIAPAGSISAKIQTLTNEVDTIVNDLSAKNLFDIEKWLTTVGLAYTKNGDTYTTSTGGQSYGTPFSFADADIDVTISGIITNDTSDYARIEVLNASNEMVATIKEGTTSASGKGCKVRLNWSVGGNFSIEKPMIRPASIEDSTYVPYAKTNQQLTEDTNAIEPILNVLGAKNLLKNTASPATVNGITFTVRSDGSVTANGTATATASLRISQQLPKGKYIVSGLQSAGSNQTFRMWIGIRNSSDTDWVNSYFIEEESGLEFEVPSGSPYVRVECEVRSGYTASNLVFKPMIRPADIKDSTYVPYTMTNRELTEKSIIKDVSGYSWDSAIDGTKDVIVKRYGAIVSVYGYFRSTNALAQYADVLSGLPHCASGAAKSTDALRNMGMTLQNAGATSKFVVDSATTANLQYAFNFVYLTDAN